MYSGEGVESFILGRPVSSPPIWGNWGKGENNGSGKGGQQIKKGGEKAILQHGSIVR